MINGLRVVVVMPAYHASKTVEMTWQALPHDIVDHVLLVDDASTDGTAELARSLGIEVLLHDRNLGYGANQKTCYDAALATEADIVIMVHPDYQYDPRLVTAMAAMISSGVYDAVIGSRILGGQALAGGMPIWKYVANRILTFVENVLLGERLSEYHSGFRAFSREVLEQIRYSENSDDFIFDNEMLVQIILGKFRLGEISVPTRYFDNASSISLHRAIVYGFGVLRVSVLGFLWRAGLRHTKLFRLVAGDH